jgi:hypothetical protein
VNYIFAQILSGYNQKHPRTWDENLVYIQHSYNNIVHASTSKSPFETCFGYFTPFPLNVVYGQQGRVGEDTTREALKDKMFFDKIRSIHLQVHGTLNNSQENYKAR